MIFPLKIPLLEAGAMLTANDEKASYISGKAVPASTVRRKIRSTRR
jgi:hypothetical protein